MKRDFINITDFSKSEILILFERIKEYKKRTKNHQYSDILKGYTLGLIFHKPSLRTRISFEVAMSQLGGDSLYITENEIGIGTRESVEDIARVISRYVNIVVIRTYSHNFVKEFARYSRVPIINGLTDEYHPTQALTDIFTIMEKKGSLDNIKIAYVGDGNNVANSLILACSLFEKLSLSIASPDGYKPDLQRLRKEFSINTQNIFLYTLPADAVKDADVIYTDVWTSMGQEDEAEKRREIFKEYQVNRQLLSYAKKDVIIMHCLPAHRGEEITDDIIDSEKSVVFEQAENRLHVHKGILLKLLNQI